MSVYVVRAFVNMRRELLTDATLEVRLEKIEKTLLTHDTGLRELYETQTVVTAAAGQANSAPYRIPRRRRITTTAG